MGSNVARAVHWACMIVVPPLPLQRASHPTLRWRIHAEAMVPYAPAELMPMKQRVPGMTGPYKFLSSAPF